MGRGLSKYPIPERGGQLARSTDSTPVMGWGRGLQHWSEIFPEGVPPIGSPTDSSKTIEEPPAEPMEEAGATSNIDSPVEASTMARWDKMPPLEEEEEVIAELDSASDEAGDEEEDEPEPLDEADIAEMTRCCI